MSSRVRQREVDDPLVDRNGLKTNRNEGNGVTCDEDFTEEVSVAGLIFRSSSRELLRLGETPWKVPMRRLRPERVLICYYRHSRY